MLHLPNDILLFIFKFINYSYCCKINDILKVKYSNKNLNKLINNSNIIKKNKIYFFNIKKCYSLNNFIVCSKCDKIGNNEIIILKEIFNQYKEQINDKYKLHFKNNNKFYKFTYFMKSETLNINNNNIDVSVNKYPNLDNQIILSTMVKNEDNYIKQWINYHHSIGINKFIIYDNAGIDDKKSYCSIEKSSNLPLLLEEYIKNNIVILIQWPYFKRLPNTGISGQTTQQNHTLYAFKKSKYIGFFDIDEYINMQNQKDINSFFDNLIKTKNINVSNIGNFHIKNKFFYNPNKMSTDGYNFLKIYNCNETTTPKGHEKNFVIPKNVDVFANHQVTKGLAKYNVDPKDLYFNHYSFLNKDGSVLTRYGGGNSSTSTDNSISKHINFNLDL